MRVLPRLGAFRLGGIRVRTCASQEKAYAYILTIKRMMISSRTAMTTLIATPTTTATLTATMTSTMTAATVAMLTTAATMTKRYYECYC